MPHLVLAHYMLAYPPRNAADAEADITAAQALGIDAFALNAGAWSTEPRYKAAAQLLFDAADHLGNFSLCLSADMTKPLSPADIQDMVCSFRSRPSYLHEGGAPVLSTFVGQKQTRAFWNKALLAIGAVTFVPGWYLGPSPTPEFIVAHAESGPIIEGLFHFGAAGTPAQIAANNAAYVKACRQLNILSVASVSPAYCNQRVTPPVSFPYGPGTTGMATILDGILANPPDWLEVVTWNDYSEQDYIYLPPDLAARNPVPASKFALPDHSAHAALLATYIARFKALP